MKLHTVKICQGKGEDVHRKYTRDGVPYCSLSLYNPGGGFCKYLGKDFVTVCEEWAFGTSRKQYLKCDKEPDLKKLNTN